MSEGGAATEQGEVEGEGPLGIVAVSSPAYVHAAFECLRRGRLFVPLRSVDDRERIDLTGVREVVTPEAGGGWVEEAPPLDRSDAPAEILFTSGTEGAPKGVVRSHRALADVVDRLDAAMHLDASIREYVGVPVYHSFGFGRCRAVAAAGGRCYLPPHGFDPAEVAAMLEAGSINALSAVPSLLRVLLASGAVTPQLGARVRWIEIGSQPMSRAEKEAVRALFPRAAIVQHYGLTEASRSTLLEIHRASGEQLESVGRPSGAVQVRILDDGRIAVRGPHVASALLVDGRRVAATDPDGWYETGDLGALRDDHLLYLGRADDVINCGGLKLSPEVLEADVRARLGDAEGFAICRMPDPVRGEGVLLVAEQGLAVSDDALRDALDGAVRAGGVEARAALALRRVSALPRTPTGKVARRVLAEGLGREVAAERVVAEQDPGGPSVRAIYAKYLGPADLDDDASFTSLGGDSLAFIQVAVDLETYLGFLPDGWENLGIATLEALPREHAHSVALEPMVWLRFLAIAAIVIDHSHALGTLRFPGGADLLMVLSGLSFARFQLQQVVRTQRARPILSALPKLVVPTVGFVAIELLWQRVFFWPALLMVSDFFPASVSPIRLWFVEAWLQIYLALFLVFALLPVARWARDRPLATAVGALAVGVAARLGVPLVWDTGYLFEQVPHMHFWCFALGWVIAAAGGSHRALTTALILLFGPTLGWTTGMEVWVTLGGLVLIWAPLLRLPRPVVRAIGWVSAGSLYIYITHSRVIRVCQRLFPDHAGPIAFVLSILLGGLVRVAADRAFARYVAWRKGSAPHGGAEPVV